MNLTQYIIYQGSIMNIWWGLWSVGSEAAAITLLSWCSLWVQPRESGFCWVFPHFHPGQRPRLLVGPKGSVGALRKWCLNLPSCQAAVHPVLNLLENKGLWSRSQTGSTFTLCHDNPQLTREKLFPSDSKTCSTIDRWAWIQRCVVFCHPLLHWPWQRICRVHKAFSWRCTAALASWQLENT